MSSFWVELSSEERDKIGKEEYEAQDERNRRWMGEGVAMEGELQKQNKHIGWTRRHFAILKGRNTLLIFKNARKGQDPSQVYALHFFVAV